MLGRMPDLILTGASRGIGRALSLALAERKDLRQLLVARDEARLAQLGDEVRDCGGDAVAVPGDVGTLGSAASLGERLDGLVRPGAILVHNAGLWPSSRTMTKDGYEAAYVVNHLGPLALQRPLIASGKVRRILVVSAGLIVKGRFDPDRTPTGRDFSSIRTYCNTKLCFAIAMRDLAAQHRDLDVLVLHPGVVRTDLGARKGLLGAVLNLVKRGWETPEVCAQRLCRILSQERWSAPGRARWLVEEEEQEWPAAATDEATRAAVIASTRAAGLWADVP